MTTGASAAEVARLRLALEGAGVGTWECALDMREVRLSEVAASVLGLPAREVIESADGYLGRMPPEDRARVATALGALRARGAGDFAIEHRIIRPDGVERWVECRGRLHRDSEEGAMVLAGTLVDIHARKVQERELGRVEAQLRAVIEDQTEMIVRCTRDGTRLFVNGAYCRAFGGTPETLVGTSFLELVPEPDRSAVVRKLSSLSPDAPVATDLHRARALDGTLRWYEWTDRGRFDADGELVEILSVGRDLTERVEAERALRESEARLRQVAESIHEVVWLEDRDAGRILYVSPAYECLTGRPLSELHASPQAFLAAVHPDDRERVRACIDEDASRERDDQFRVVRPDGDVRWARRRAFPIRDEEGRVHRVAGVIEDITERLRIEEQLRQAQKMDAVGQLAGGIAHDFNNILSVILLLVRQANDSPGVPGSVSAALSEIEDSATRAASLTRQLLQLGRRQVMQPRALDLNHSVLELTNMLGRVVGDAVRIELRMHDRPLVVHADAGMIDQALLNIVVNARDALPDGGTVWVETGRESIGPTDASSELAPGEYAVLAVRDNGIGIDEDALAHVFEPFFTTKEPGKGTGLGLATVMGIVRQHRGTISVTSRVGSGSTFRILLPLVDGPPVQVPPKPIRPARGGAETILVVDDDATVRTLTRRLLERHGYAVVEAATGRDALDAWDDYQGAIDLLLSDLVMPGGVSGRDLARRLRARAAALKVVLTSGYSAELAGQELMLPAGERFLQKPFAPMELLRVVRDSLEQ